MTYEPLSEVDVQNIDRQIKLYVNDAIPELEVSIHACTIIQDRVTTKDRFHCI